MNTQRQVIYDERHKILEGRDLKDEAVEMVEARSPPGSPQFASKDVFPEEWDLDGLLVNLQALYPTLARPDELDELRIRLEARCAPSRRTCSRAYDRKEEELGADAATGKVILRELERMVLLSIIDTKWREHLYEMDYLQEGIGLRAYGQRDPLIEYQREAYDMFPEMKDAIQDEFVRYIYRVQLVRQDEPARPRPQRVVTNQSDDGSSGSPAPASAGDKIPRNAPCPCGSGRKYKKCHGLSA